MNAKGKKMKKKEKRNELELENSRKRANRISKIRELYCDGNNVVFAEKLGVSKQYSSGLCTAGERISERTLEKILKIFPEINRTWLFFGEGDMKIEEKTTHRHDNVEKQKSETPIDAQIVMLREMLREKESKIEELIADNAQLRQQLRSLLYKEDATVGSLEQPISTETEMSTI